MLSFNQIHRVFICFIGHKYFNFWICLSFLLYFAEHTAQPELCENGWKTMVWAFAKYLGDPGKIADFPLVTVWGNIIAIIVGVLGIAIFAVPAGLVSSGFIEVIEDRKKEEEIKKNTAKLRKAFERKLDRPSDFQIVPMFVSVPDIICRLKMSEPDVFSALENSTEFRLINLASTQTNDKHPEDRLAVEHFYSNKEYGLCIDRESKITIVSPSSLVDPIIGNFAYYAANKVIQQPCLRLANSSTSSIKAFKPGVVSISFMR